MMIETIFFYIFGGLTIAMVLMMLFSTSPVASAICLVAAFFGIAGLYVLLNASFVAGLQVLIYAGAIMVLFIFVIMLLKLAPQELAFDRFRLRRILMTVIGLLFSGFLIHHFVTVPIQPFSGLPEDFGSPEPVGRMMFTTYLVPFELLSILLLVAIIGAVMLGKKDLEKPERKKP